MLEEKKLWSKSVWILFSSFPECQCSLVTYLLPLFCVLWTGENFGTVSKTITKVGSKHLTCGQSVSVWGLRVGGEGSKQNLWHILLAKGHQEQRQALIGRIHTAALKTAKEAEQIHLISKKHHVGCWIGGKKVSISVYGNLEHSQTF